MGAKNCNRDNCYEYSRLVFEATDKYIRIRNGLDPGDEEVITETKDDGDKGKGKGGDEGNEKKKKKGGDSGFINPFIDRLTGLEEYI